MKNKKGQNSAFKHIVINYKRCYNMENQKDVMLLMEIIKDLLKLLIFFCYNNWKFYSYNTIIIVIKYTYYIIYLG